jgi:hypothetical protein
VAEVVPAEGPRTASGEKGEVRGDSASTGCGGGVSPVGAGDGDAGEQGVGEGEEGRDLAQWDAERVCARWRREEE